MNEKQLTLIEAKFQCCETGFESSNIDDFVKFEGKLYEREYFHDNFVYCEDIADYCPIDETVFIEETQEYYSIYSNEIVEINGEYYHKDSDLIVYSEYDDKYYLANDDDVAFSELRHDYMHVASFDELFAFCESCGNECYREDLDSDYLCEDCRHESRVINNYTYKPIPKFFGTNSKRFFGIELEVENIDETIYNEDMAEIIVNESLFYCKSDGSLSNGFEIVSYPASFDYWKKHSLAFLSTLQTNGFRSYNTDSCGIHIHVSKNSVSQLTLYKMLTFFSNNIELIKTISQRKEDKLQSWASVSTDKRSFCEISKKKGGHVGRYVAINLQNQNTIEFRIFRGTLYKQSFLKNIEFVDSLINWCQQTSYKDINKNDYFIYIRNNKSIYKNLFNFLKNKGVLTCVS